MTSSDPAPLATGSYAVGVSSRSVVGALLNTFPILPVLDFRFTAGIETMGVLLVALALG